MTRTSDLVLIGGGEHARVVLDAAQRAGRWRVLGYTDRQPVKAMGALGLAWLGTDADVVESLRSASVVLAIGSAGDMAERRRIADRWNSAGLTWATVVHPEAVVARGAVIEPGAVVLARAVVNDGARVGYHAIVNTGAIIEHDVSVGAFAHVAPGAVIGGGTSIGEAAFIGLGARLRDHLTIGPGAVVGMGSVVVASVGGGEKVMGVPARSGGSPTHRTREHMPSE
jgi:acetyltransferase EpsM